MDQKWRLKTFEWRNFNIEWAQRILLESKRLSFRLVSPGSDLLAEDALYDPNSWQWHARVVIYIDFSQKEANRKPMKQLIYVC